MNQQTNYKNNKNRKVVMEHLKKQENNNDDIEEVTEDIKELLYTMLADDDSFLTFMHLIPMQLLEGIISKKYLLARYNSLVKSGKIKVPKDINE